MAYIDVIMPVFNDEKSTGDAVESILSQTFTDWRLLICDDGSKDQTLKIITEYSDKHPNKIVVLQNDENKGITYTLNKLLAMSTAKYIARMDSDDKSMPERFEKQFNFLERNLEYAMVGSNIIKFDEKGRFGFHRYPERPEKKDFLWNNPFAHPSVMIRKEVIDRLGGYRDEIRTRRCEDYDLWMRLYAEGFIGYNIQEPIYEYYEGRNSYRKRKFRYRIAEMRTRIYGYRKLGLMPLGIFYSCKPLFLSVIPSSIMKRIRRGKQ